MSDQTGFLLKNLPNLLLGFPGHRPGGLFMSILLAAAAISLGFLLALLIGIGHESRWRPVRLGSHVYVQLFRGVPLILLLLIVHQLLRVGRFVGLPRTPWASALIALTLYSSAYQAEIVRAGLQAVPRCLVESARLLGSSPVQAFRRIKLRYALTVMLPAFTGAGDQPFQRQFRRRHLGRGRINDRGPHRFGQRRRQRALLGRPGTCWWDRSTSAVAFSLSRLAQRWERGQHIGGLVHSPANY